MRGPVAALAVAVALLAAGCGGEEETGGASTYYQPPVRTPTYSNPDGSAPLCFTIPTNGARLCNTSEPIVSVSRAINDGQLTMEQAARIMQGECANEGYSLYDCASLSGILTQLFTFNLLHGLPQET